MWILWDFLKQLFVGHKAKGRISKRVSQESKARQSFWKNKTFLPLLLDTHSTCVYQRVRNVCFSEILACFAFLKHPFWDSPFCFITDVLRAASTLHIGLVSLFFTCLCLLLKVLDITLLDFSNPAAIYLFKVNNGNTRTMCEICSKLTINISKQCYWHRFGVFIVNMNRFHTLFLCFHCWLWTSKCRLGIQDVLSCNGILNRPVPSVKKSVWLIFKNTSENYLKQKYPVHLFSRNLCLLCVFWMMM